MKLIIAAFIRRLSLAVTFIAYSAWARASIRIIKKLGIKDAISESFAALLFVVLHGLTLVSTIVALTAWAWLMRLMQLAIP